MENKKINSGNKNKKRKRILILILIFFILFIPAWYLLGKWAQGYGFEGAGDFVRTVTVNYWSSFDAEYETIEITISDSDFQKLSDQRDLHLKKGLITKTDDRYVPGIITYNGKKIKSRIRLKGHMTDHLQDKKWSLRVKTTGGDAFNGMRIFTLQHPGTRNYIYEWIYHQMLTEEGIASVRYSFINVKLNGESWGIYAVEENFGDELTDYRKLPNGPLLGFNPDLYWYNRLNHHEKIDVDYVNIDGISSYPDAYNEDALFKNKERKSDYAEALFLLEKFKRGDLKTSQVFDIDKLARFHAIIDLIGGHFSLDWSDVKYYYNPITQLIEPIGYESFSVQKTKQLSGANKFRNNPEVNAQLHSMIFSDIAFFEKYVQHLNRISEKKYLDRFFDKYESKIEDNLKILYTEFPYKKLPLDLYYENQHNIRTLLNTPITSTVYFERKSDSTLFLTAGNSSVLPVVIREMEVDGKKVKLKNSISLSARAKNEHVFYEPLQIPFLTDSIKKDIRFLVSYPGSKKTTEIKVKPVSIENRLNSFVLTNKNTDLSKYNFIQVDNTNKEIYFTEKNITFKEDVYFPEDYSLQITQGITVHLNNGSALFVKKIITNGTDENPVVITSDDSTGIGFVILNSTNKNIFKYTHFINLNSNRDKSETYNAIVTAYQSEIIFENCIFSSQAQKAVLAYRSNLNFKSTQFLNFDNKAVQCYFSKVTMNGSEFLNCKESIDLNSSTGVLNNLKVLNSKIGFRFDNGSSVNGKNWKMEGLDKAIIATDNSKVKIEMIEVKSANVAFTAEKKSDVYGPASIEVSGYKKSKVKSDSESDKNSKIKIK